ncbi:MAG: hypothetical protein ABIH37_01215 [archaeon]
MVNLNIKIENKVYYLLVLILVIIVINGFVIAFTTDGSGDPTKMGHSLDEVQMPSCSEGQVLKYLSGVWGCGTDNGGSSVLSCRVVASTTNTGSGGSYTVYAECNAGELAVAGGCSDDDTTPPMGTIAIWPYAKFRSSVNSCNYR